MHPDPRPLRARPILRIGARRRRRQAHPRRRPARRLRQRLFAAAGPGPRPGRRRPSGRALLDFLENSGPTASANTTPNQTETNRGDADSRDADSPEADSANNPLRAVKNAASTGPSTGPTYLWILIATALLLTALGWRRYRTHRH